MPLAKRWGIGDDYEREEAVRTASPEERDALVAAIDGAPDELWDWLAGGESFSAAPTHEYVAVTKLTMAAELARLLNW